MALTVKYGGFTHEGSPGVTISRVRTFGPRNKPETDEISIEIDGFVIGTGDQQKTKIDKLIAAYQQNDQNFRWRTADNKIRFQLLNADTQDGIKVISPPSFPVGSGPEWADGARRSYTVSLSASVLASAKDRDEVMEFSETITFQRKEDRTFFAQPIDGPMVPFVLVTAANMPSRATQSGTALGRTAYPEPPEPIWPPDGSTIFHETPPEISRTSGENHTNASTAEMFRVSWSYSMIATTQDLETIQSEPNQFIEEGE